MAKQQILLVDADSSSARVLEVSLRSAGFTVTTADSAENALEKLEHGAPDLILTDTRLPGADGFEFVRGLRARPELKDVPIVFLTEQGALEDKLRGLELGVDDYLAKPIFVREVVTRVHMLLARKNQQRIATESAARTRFSGSLEDVAVVDLLQTIAVSGKSGVASVRRGDREAQLYFRNGQLVDAEVGDLRGEEAVYRTITWTSGSFDLEFRAVDRPSVIEATTNALLMEGLRRVDELGRLAEQLPPENTIVDVDHDALLARLNEIPDELNGVLRLIDGKRTLLDLIDGSPFDDLSTLTVLSKFYFEGLLVAVEPTPGDKAAPSSERLSAPPGEEDTSGLVLEPSPVAAQAGAAASVARDDRFTSAGVTEAAAPKRAPSAPPTQRAPEPPQPVRVVVSQDEEPPSRVPTAASSGLRAPSASLVPAAAKPTLPAPPPEPQRPTPQAPVVRIAAPAAVTDQPKVTPKVIVNIGDDSPRAPKVAEKKVAEKIVQAKLTPAPGSVRVSRAEPQPAEPQPAERHYTNGHSNGAGVAHSGVPQAAVPQAAVPQAAVPQAAVPQTRAEPVSAAPFALAQPREAPVTPIEVKPEGRTPHDSAETAATRAVESLREADDSDLYPPTALRSTRGSTLLGVLRAPVALAEPAPELPAAPEAPTHSEELELSPSHSAPTTSLPLHPTPPAAGQHRISEDDFFDAGDEGTYAGGPRSSIPAPDSDLDSDHLPEVVYRSTPAHRARVRRTTRLVAGVVAIATLSLLIAVWRSVGTTGSEEAELARDERSGEPRVEAASASPAPKEGWPVTTPAAPNPEPSATGEAQALEAAAEAAPDPAAAGEVEGTQGDLAAPAVAEAATSTNAAEPGAAAALTQPEPKRTAALAAAPSTPAQSTSAQSMKRARVNGAPESAPKFVGPTLHSEKETLAPRRASGDKPPTASYPPL